MGRDGEGIEQSSLHSFCFWRIIEDNLLSHTPELWILSYCQLVYLQWFDLIEFKIKPSLSWDQKWQKLLKQLKIAGYIGLTWEKVMRWRWLFWLNRSLSMVRDKMNPCYKCSEISLVPICFCRCFHVTWDARIGWRRELFRQQWVNLLFWYPAFILTLLVNTSKMSADYSNSYRKVAGSWYSLLASIYLTMFCLCCSMAMKRVCASLCWSSAWKRCYKNGTVRFPVDSFSAAFPRKSTHYEAKWCSPGLCMHNEENFKCVEDLTRMFMLGLSGLRGSICLSARPILSKGCTFWNAWKCQEGKCSSPRS